MRTHESVLLANLPVTAKSVSGEGWHAVKYDLAGTEIMERRLVVVKCTDGSVNLHNQYNALGSFHKAESINLTREQIAFIKEKL